MAIDWPEDITPTTCSFWLEANTAVNQSPLTRATQVIIRPGARWHCDLTFNQRSRVVAARIDAMLAQLDGSGGEMTLWDFRRPFPRGDAGLMVNPIVTTFTDGTEFSDATDFLDAYAAEFPYIYQSTAKGASALVVGGWGGLEHALLAGDYIGVGGYLYIVCDDARADAMGRASLTIRPNLRADVDVNAAITITRPRCRFRLADNSQGDNRTDGNFRSTYTLSFLESLP